MQISLVPHLCLPILQRHQVRLLGVCTEFNIFLNHVSTLSTFLPPLEKICALVRKMFFYNYPEKLHPLWEILADPKGYRIFPLIPAKMFSAIIIFLS